MAVQATPMAKINQERLVLLLLSDNQVTLTEESYMPDNPALLGRDKKDK